LNRLAKLIFWRAGFSELQQPVVAPCDKNELICPSSGKSRAPSFRGSPPGRTSLADLMMSVDRGRTEVAFRGCQDRF
jgi:hypothetical protein